LQPIDWTEQKLPKAFADPYETERLAEHAVPMTEDLQRIQSLGFNTDIPLYKGGSMQSRTSTALPDPAKKGFERGSFFAADPDVAQVYGMGHTGRYFARAPKAMEIDYKAASGGTRGYDDAHVTPIIDAARQKGADLVVIRGMRDIGAHRTEGLQDQYVVLNPSIVRRREAKFDPAKLDLNNLLAGLGGLGVIAPGVMQGAKDE
jgi:hypothetical protein